MIRRTGGSLKVALLRLALVLVLVPERAHAVPLSPVQAYNEGNRLYAAKDYEGAVRAYEKALEAGHDPRVHYNLGNALFRAGKVGEAIASWRRARYLAPRDRDVENNLGFARAYRVDKTLPAAGPLARALGRAFEWMSRREAALAMAIAFTLAGLALAAWIVWRVAALGYGAALLAVVGGYALVAQQLWANEVAARPAVIVQSEVSAASGPGDEFKAVMLLHDGTEVLVREVRGDYDLVQLPGGSGGWLKKDALERVY